MRYQGKVINWKDDQGFGFVIPNGGGQKAFVHIKAFSDSVNRPTEGDLITYELATDERNRFFAKNIRFAGDSAVSGTYGKSSLIGTYFAAVFCLLITFCALLGLLPFAIVGLYFIVSVVTFLAYGIDKSAAKNGSWRTQESTLHLLSLVGGWPGALIAQKTFSHKSRKQEFQTVFQATVIANCFALGWLLLTKSSANFLSAIMG